MKLTLSLAIFSLIIQSHESSSSLPSNSFLGIPPQDEDEDYFKGEIIKCKNGSKKFSQTQLNDDFFDCPDGTDEPDCCDGSDEYDGKVKCPNTCREAGKVARDKLEKKIEMYHGGLALRKQEIGQAKQAIARDKAELLGLKNEKVVKQLEEQIQKLEQKECLEKEDKMKEASNEKIENEKSGPEENVDGQIKPLKISDVEKMGLSGESPSDQNEEAEHESSEELSREELGHLVASRWTGKKTGDQVEEIDPAKSDHMGDKEESAHDEHFDNNSLQFNEKTQKHQEKGRKDAKDAGDEESVAENAGLSSAHYKIGSEDREKSSDANQVWKEYNNYAAKLSDIESRISGLTEKFKYDFGIEKELYLFYDRCFESKQDKYVYKVCPFKDATQEEGSSETRLGNWEKFENSYRMMLFSNGDGCWNGPDRSLKVKLRFGLKNELTGVDEPSHCEYVALMYTPALCLEEKLKELKQKLESMNREQPWSHDEL